jgi:hypothetical protein
MIKKERNLLSSKMAMVQVDIRKVESIKVTTGDPIIKNT